jgi:hypothetical protein
MALRKLDKAEWRPFCDVISKTLTGKRAEIEVASLSLGDQIEAEWLPFLGIVYDPKNDMIEIALEGVDHMIRKPREFFVDLGPDGLASFEIVDADGTREIIRLRDPLMLPAPHQAAKTA